MPHPNTFSGEEEEDNSMDDEDMEEKNSEASDDSASEESVDEENANMNNGAVFEQNRRMSMSGMLESPVHSRSVPIGIQRNSQPITQPRRMSLVNSPPISFGLLGRPEYAGKSSALCSVVLANNRSVPLLFSF